MKTLRWFVLGFAVLLAGCASIERVAYPPLRVGVSPQFPPLVFMQNEQLAGVEIDFARELGKKLGREVRFVTVRWDDQVTTLLVNETDIIMSGMTALVMRPEPVSTNLTNSVHLSSHEGPPVRMAASAVAFTMPYLSNDLRVVSRAADAAKFASMLADTSLVRTIKIRIGFLEGSTAEAAITRDCPAAERIEFRNRDQALAKVRAGEVDLFVDEGYALATIPPTKDSGLVVLPEAFASDPLVWAVRPGARQLRLDINEILKRWIADGTRDRIVKRWMPQLSPAR